MPRLFSSQVDSNESAPFQALGKLLERSYLNVQEPILKTMRAARDQNKPGAADDIKTFTNQTTRWRKELNAFIEKVE
jgi:hypothetical protein